MTVARVSIRGLNVDKRALSCERHVNIRIVIIFDTGYSLGVRA